MLVLVDAMVSAKAEPNGSEISTHTIDKLAKSGMLFTDFQTLCCQIKMY